MSFLESWNKLRSRGRVSAFGLCGNIFVALQQWQIHSQSLNLVCFHRKTHAINQEINLYSTPKF